MRNLKKITEEQKVICSSGKSIMYTCENKLGNFMEEEVIKHAGKFYHIKACNKHIEEFMEV